MGNWTWGLSLIALTMAIHATGIAFMAFTTLRIRDRMESLSRLRLHHWFAIAVPVIGAVGLLLAALQSGGGRARSPRRSAAPARRSIERSLQPRWFSTERASARSALAGCRR